MIKEKVESKAKQNKKVIMQHIVLPAPFYEFMCSTKQHAIKHMVKKYL